MGTKNIPELFYLDTVLSHEEKLDKVRWRVEIVFKSHDYGQNIIDAQDELMDILDSSVPKNYLLEDAIEPDHSEEVPNHDLKDKKYEILKCYIRERIPKNKK